MERHMRNRHYEDYQNIRFQNENSFSEFMSRKKVGETLFTYVGKDGSEKETSHKGGQECRPQISANHEAGGSSSTANHSGKGLNTDAATESVSNETFQNIEENDQEISSIATQTDGQSFTCTVCPAVFTELNESFRHMKFHIRKNPSDSHLFQEFLKKYNLSTGRMRHPDGRPFQCTKCRRCFRCLIGFNWHLNKHIEGVEKSHSLTDKRMYQLQCDECGKLFYSRQGFRIHKFKHARKKIKPHKCIVCDKKFTQKSSLRIHMRMHTWDLPHRCTFCNQQFPQKHMLKQHMRKHTGKISQSLACCVCKKKFDKNCNLMSHIRRAHEGEKCFECDKCGKKFISRHAVRSHSWVHTADLSHKCTFCEEQFLRKDILESHMRKHTGETSHACSICDRKFNLKCNLAVHMRTHTGEKPFQCAECGKKFSQRCALNTHSRLHTGDKPFKCSVCEKQFTSQDGLVKHRRTHTGEKPFKCTVCGKAFTQSGSVKLHMKSHK